jgi:glycine/D-amino acid oxidase-like deaminating enzyme
MQVDYLIIGQGISGSILAYELLKAGKRVMVIDNHLPHESSRIAAGLFSPVTGRKMVKTWMFDEIFPEAFDYYTKLEKELNIKFFHPTPLHHVLSSVKEINDLSQHFAQREYVSLADFDHLETISQLLHCPLGTLQLNHSGWCEVNVLLETIRSFLLERNCLLTEEADVSAITRSGSAWHYNNISCDAIIFCEGHRVKQNPFFTFLDMRPVKGEIITIHAPELKLRHIIKQQHWIIPMGNDYYKVGATFDFNRVNNQPTIEGKKQLTDVFDKFFKVPYTIVKHEAAIRPAMHDRRPVIGQHPSLKGLYLFNGLGAKGVTLVPYWGKRFLSHLSTGKILPKEVSVNRFVD